MEALADIRGYAQAGRVLFTRHASQRIRERSTSRREVEDALARCERCRWQPHEETWRAEGPDWDGERLTVALVIADGLLVVTVFD